MPLSGTTQVLSFETRTFEHTLPLKWQHQKLFSGIETSTWEEVDCICYTSTTSPFLTERGKDVIHLELTIAFSHWNLEAPEGLNKFISLLHRSTTTQLFAEHTASPELQEVCVFMTDLWFPQNSVILISVQPDVRRRFCQRLWPTSSPTSCFKHCTTKCLSSKAWTFWGCAQPHNSLWLFNL